MDDLGHWGRVGARGRLLWLAICIIWRLLIHSNSFYRTCTHSGTYTGFGSAFFAVLYSGVFYWLYASAITELAARYRTSGGSFDFVKAAMGKKYAASMVNYALFHSLFILLLAY